MKDIVYITDQGYFLPTLVSIQSLIASVEGPQVYHVYCLCDGLTEKQKQMMEQLETPQAQIHLLDRDKVAAGRSLERLKKHSCSANPTALLKFDLANIFPDKDRILYLDGDTIVKSNIDSIFDVDIQHTYAAVVLDKKALLEKKYRNYFNSGVMLLNLAKIRQDKLCDILYEKKLSSTDTSLMDQNVFNDVFDGEIVVLPIKYNYMHSEIMRMKHFKGLTLETFDKSFDVRYQTWEEVLEDACIVHYASKDKPWKFEDTLCVELWDYFYSQTPLSSKPLQRRRINYSFLFGLSDYVIFRSLALFLWDCKVLGTRRALRQDIKKLFKLVHRPAD